MSEAAEDANTTNNGSTKYTDKTDNIKVSYVVKEITGIAAWCYTWFSRTDQMWKSAVSVPYGTFRPPGMMY